VLERHLFIYHLRQNCCALRGQSGDQRSDLLRARSILPISDRLAIYPFGLWPSVDTFLAWPHVGGRASRWRAVAVSAGLQARNAGRPYREYAVDLADHVRLAAWAAGLCSTAVRLESSRADRVCRQRP